MKKYKFAVFDLDGTLLDTLDDLTAAVNHALKKYNLPERTVTEVAAFLGNGAGKLIELSTLNGQNNPYFKDILAEFKKYYAENNSVYTKPYEKIPYVLNELTKQGIKIALVSNKFDLAVKELEKKYFDGIFSSAVGECDGIKRKPAPDLVFKAMKIMGAEKENTVYIGDSEVDIKTAENCGTDCISVSWGFRNREELIKSGGKIIIDKPEELLKFF